MKMKRRHLELFTQMIQSPQVQVAFGDDRTEKIYCLPVGLLRERSTVFSRLLPEKGSKEVVKYQIQSMTSVVTLNAFVAWIMAARPQLDEDKLEDSVELAVLADHLGVWALSNQAMDLIESQLGSVDQHKGFVEDEKYGEEAWDTVFLAHAALGCDYRRAKRRQEKSRSRWLTESPCEYHEHPWKGASIKDEMARYFKACAYATDDCYPVWKVQDVDQVKSETDVEVAKSQERDDCTFKNTAKPEPEPEPAAEDEIGPRIGVTADDSPAAESKTTMEEDPPVVVEEDDRPGMTLHAITAEIERLSGKNRKKLKTWLKNGGMSQVLATEYQLDDWVQAP